MRLTIDCRMLRHSGITSYILNTVPHLVAAHPEAHFNLLGDPKEMAEHAWTRAGNVTCIACTAPIYSIPEQRELPRRIPKETDLLWCPHYNIPVLYRGKLVATLHDALHIAMPQFAGGGAHKRAYARLMFSALRRRASTIMCDSQFTAAELARHVRGHTSQLRVIYLGVAESWLHVEKGPRPHDRSYLLYVGNVKPHKNLLRLLEAFGQVRDQVPHDLVIVGRREGFITPDEAVGLKAAELGLRVQFTGHVDHSALQQYYAHADALVFPTLYEGFGLPPLEAMACGCPVVASRAASLPEVCADAALYCDPYSAADIAARIHQIVRDDALRSELVRKGLERARGFRWEETASAVWEALEQALPGRHAGERGAVVTR